MGATQQLLIAIAATIIVALPAQAKCPQDAVQVGPICVDKYESSIWKTTDQGTIKKIQKGKVGKLADLSAATQVGSSGDNYGAGCPDTGNGCMQYYAVSIPTTPSGNVTWFQAAAACRNSGKRLLTNQEWQVAAFGTPDGGACNLGNTIVPTGTPGCVSDVGAFDMVGNLNEWVADWTDVATDCTSWSAAYGADQSCFGGSGSTEQTRLPGAPLRGGTLVGGTNAGVFSIEATAPLSYSLPNIGFRCAR